MKKIIRTALTAGLLAFFAAANAQDTDTTGYSNTYNQDTTTYDTDREQQGSDTYNNTQNETEYSDTQSSDRYNQQTDDQRDYTQDRTDDQSVKDSEQGEYGAENRSDMYNDPTTRPGYGTEQERSSEEDAETTIHRREGDKEFDKADKRNDETGYQEGRDDQRTKDVDQQDEGRSGMYDDPATRPGFDDVQERTRNEESGSTPGRSETDQVGIEDAAGDSENQRPDQSDENRSGVNEEPYTQPGWNQDQDNTRDQSAADKPGYENQSSDYNTRDQEYSENNENNQDSLRSGNQKNDQSRYPETSSSQRGWNQESGTEPVENSETSVHDQQDPVRQEGLDKNKDYNHTGDQSYNDEQPRNTGIGSEDEIGPESEEAHRQAREELGHATDTLDYESQRNADPDRVGNRIENMADTVSEKAHERDRARHGLED